jgi:hypothetical protein
MELQLPFSTEEFVDAAYELELDENKRMRRYVPRASSLGGCARKQAYYLMDVDPSNPQRDDDYRRNGVLTTEQGRYIEDLSCDVISQIEAPGGAHFAVVNRQVQLPVGSLVSGHPDGELVVNYGQGDGGSGPVGYGPMPDGMKWGFEHKHLGRYSYMDLFKNGYASNKEYWNQLLLYGYYLDWDAVLVCVLAQDQSGIRQEKNEALRRLKTSKNPGYYRWAESPTFDTKVQLHAFYLRPHYVASIPRLEERARWLATVDRPQGVAREADAIKVNPRGNPAFPCGFCDYADRCIADGPGTEVAPAC